MDGQKKENHHGNNKKNKNHLFEYIWIGDFLCVLREF